MRVTFSTSLSALSSVMLPMVVSVAAGLIPALKRSAPQMPVEVSYQFGNRYVLLLV